MNACETSVQNGNSGTELICFYNSLSRRLEGRVRVIELKLVIQATLVRIGVSLHSVAIKTHGKGFLCHEF